MPPTALDRHGAYSQALVSADVSALQAVYQNNGFSKVKITPETSTPETVAADASIGERCRLRKRARNRRQRLWPWSTTSKRAHSARGHGAPGRE